jgi:hypothetical protein
MEGAPSSVVLFAPKPELDRQAGKRIDIATFNADTGPLMKSQFRFRQYGESGDWVCDQFPHLARHVDERRLSSPFTRVRQPHSGPLPDQHRPNAAGLSGGRLLDDLWSGFDDFDGAFNPSIPRKQVFDMATCRFIRESRDALLIGPPGVGKSFVAQAVGYQAIRQGFVVR